jgi:class 3 adenylate cyclase/CHASE2 domain-containing sensor protein
MTRIQRRLLRDTAVIGVTLTAFVAVLGYFTRALMPIDDWFYDRRAQLCQFFTPKPTDKLIHVDIDDPTLETIGQWPWPRSQMAEIVDEINRAGAKAISMDILFPEPSNPSPRIKEVSPGKFVKIDDDAIFADAIKRSGNCLIPVSLAPREMESPIYARLREWLQADLELNEADCYQRLLKDPKKILPMGSPFPADIFIRARREAMNERVRRELEKGEADFDELRQRLLPRTDPEFSGSPLLRLLRDEQRHAQALMPMRRFMFPIPPDAPPLVEFDGALTPILPFGRAAAISGYVDYLQTSETIRAIPLLGNFRGQLFPQTDLALFCHFLGVDVRKVRLSKSRLVIPSPPGMTRDVEIPIRDVYVPQFRRDVGCFMDIPARGGRDWATLYDPDHKKPLLHLSMGAVWDVHLIGERIARNNASMDLALGRLLNDGPGDFALDPDRYKAYSAGQSTKPGAAARTELITWTRKELRNSPLWEFTKLKDTDLKPEEKLQRDEMLAADRVLAATPEQNRRFDDQLSARRKMLRDSIGGRAVMIGWTATGKTDFFPTAIQPTCPGVVIHGMVFNALMTYVFWYHAPPWVTALVTVVMGLTITAANGLLKPSWAFVTAVILGALYLAINGLVLFDYGKTIVGCAGPMVALGSVWATGALAGFLLEATERARITKRFSSYTDPKLVDFVIENPDAALDGQVREMSVIFTDLAGFTTLSEQLRERTVSILSEYLSLMVPVIRKNDGFVNKFLGDGIMCFFNAPSDDPDHAVHAVQTALEMQKKMQVFTEALVAQGLPRVAMRCGVSTGTMVVGDSGPADASDYTVLGDTVNFASRLEGANKALGTNILISHRTTELLGDNRFLLRPVGKLQVVGKKEGVMTYEPLAPFDEATPQDLICSTMSTEMIGAYFARDFEKCIEFADKMDQQIGATKLAALYRKASKQLIENPPGPEFAGNLILTEK